MVLSIVPWKFGKAIRLIETIWFDKIRKEHREFGQRTEFPDEMGRL
jgi:hypothetical protein